ncbi:hypothetical protein TNCV_2099611 [Trichonephila clavipes]|nr:hypothetical protein TNCV_2099611 [Trichonephila clavipes]
MCKAVIHYQRTQAFESQQCFREGRESVEKGKHSGLQQTSRTTQHIEKVSATGLKNRLQTIAELVGIPSNIPTDHVGQWILTKGINFHRVCQHIVPRMLNEDQSTHEVKSASQIELMNITKIGFQICFDDLYKPLKKCIVTQGSYFEGGCISID